MHLRDLRVGSRLGGAFAVVLALLAAVAAVGVGRITSLGAVTQQVAVVDWRKAVAANQLAIAVNAAARAKLTLFATTDSSSRAAASAQVADARSQINTAYTVLDSVLVAADEQVLLARVKAARKVHAAAFDSAAALQKRG